MEESQTPQTPQTQTPQAPLRIENEVVFYLKTVDDRIFEGPCEHNVVRETRYVSINIPNEIASLRVVALGDSDGDADFSSSYVVAKAYDTLIAEDRHGNKYHVAIVTSETKTLIGNAIECPSGHGTQLVLAQPTYSRKVSIEVTVKPLSEIMEKVKWTEEDINELFTKLDEPELLAAYLIELISDYIPTHAREVISKSKPSEEDNIVKRDDRY